MGKRFVDKLSFLSSFTQPFSVNSYPWYLCPFYCLPQLRVQPPPSIKSMFAPCTLDEARVLYTPSPRVSHPERDGTLLSYSADMFRIYSSELKFSHSNEVNKFYSWDNKRPSSISKRRNEPERIFQRRIYLASLEQFLSLKPLKFSASPVHSGSFLP